jgi:hypothetical protein
MSQPNVDPKEVFGADLSAVFGPKIDRVHISTLTRSERRKLLEGVPKYLPTDSLGKDPSIFQVVNLVLNTLKQLRCLKGIDLDWHTTDDIKEKGLQRCDEQYIAVEHIVKNNKVQRGIQLRHLLEDILFCFDPKWVQTGLARYDIKTGKWYLNDAQHRFVACVILGIRHIPLEYIESQLRSDDVWQYSAVNLRSLVASEFDKYRNMVQAVESLLDEDPKFNTDKLDQEYVNAYDIKNILDAHNAKLIEKGGDAAGQFECAGVGNIIRHYEDYSARLFRRAISIHTEVWSKSPIGTPNIWGICEFIKTQEAEGVLDKDPFFVLDAHIVEALVHKYEPNRYGYHLEVKRALKAHDVAKELGIPESAIYSSGIHKLIQVTSPEVDWAPIKFGGKVIADKYLDAYPVPPKVKAVA